MRTIAIFAALALVATATISHALSIREAARFGGPGFDGWIELELPLAVGADGKAVLVIKPKSGKRLNVHRLPVVTFELDRASRILYSVLNTAESLTEAEAKIGIKVKATAAGTSTTKGAVSFELCDDAGCTPAAATFNATVEAK